VITTAVTFSAQSFGPPEFPVGFEQPRPRSAVPSPRNNASVVSGVLACGRPGRAWLATPDESVGFFGAAAIADPADTSNPAPASSESVVLRDIVIIPLLVQRS
jgi:hypothetical protein